MTSARTAIAVAAAAALSTGALADKDKNDADLFNFEHVSCGKSEYEIRVVVVGVKKAVGLITADLFPNREDGFLRSRGRLKQVKFAAKAPMTRFCISAPDAGKFAVSVYQDENANGVFDKGPFGLPAEPWGVSRNPKIRFGPPAVEEAVFDVAADGATLEIQLN